MKKSFLFLLFILLMVNSRAQINLEKTYPASADLTQLSVSGYKYFLMDVTNNQCLLYNMDHSEWKAIKLSVPAGMYLYDIRYVSETLFNTDNKVELAYTYYSYDTTMLYYTYYTMVVNEDGLELLYLPGCSYVQVKASGTNGTKLLGYVYDYSILLWTMNTVVYSLPGNMPNGVIPLEGDTYLNRPFPNPSNGMVTIPYHLPDGIGSAEIRIINGSGQVVKSYRVDRTFNNLQIQTADLPKGGYIYQLKINEMVISSGKLIHD